MAVIILSQRLQVLFGSIKQSLHSIKKHLRWFVEGILRKTILRWFPALVGQAEIENTVRKFGCKTVLHIGANLAQEAHVYERLKVEKVLWIEALPELVEQMRKNLRKDIHTVVCALLTDRDGEEHVFNIANNQALSSSIYSWGSALKAKFPDVTVASSIVLRSQTADQLLREQQLSNQTWDLLVLDVQGAELKCLQGMVSTLGKIKTILIEYSNEPFYEHAPLLADITQFLEGMGFKRAFMLVTLAHGNTIFSK